MRIKGIISIFFLFAVFFALNNEFLKGKVLGFSDGDSITILTADFTQVKIRLHGIDCPEKSQDFGNKAKQFTADLCFGKTVKVEALDTDRCGRTIGMVTLPDGNVLNKELLKVGFAWHYKYFDQSNEFSELEETAKREKVGLWIHSNAVAPWEFRKVK